MKETQKEMKKDAACEVYEFISVDLVRNRSVIFVGSIHNVYSTIG